MLQAAIVWSVGWHAQRLLFAAHRAMSHMTWVFRRCLELPLLVLCSTDDPITKATWKSLGFVFTSEEDLKVRRCILQ